MMDHRTARLLVELLNCREKTQDKVLVEIIDHIFERSINVGEEKERPGKFLNSLADLDDSLFKEAREIYLKILQKKMDSQLAAHSTEPAVAIEK